MNEFCSWVYEPCRSKIGSPKEIVGECRYNVTVMNLHNGDQIISIIHYLLNIYS